MKTRTWMVVAACLLAGFAAVRGNEKVQARPDARASDVVSLSDSDFDTRIQHGVVLVDFFATWCGPCRMQAPIVERVAKELKGKAVVCKLDVDVAPGTAGRLGIEGIPALIVFVDGRPVRRFVGVTAQDELVAAVNAALASQSSAAR